MSEFKIAGCCTCCDQPCFDVRAVWKDHERTPGEPKALGSANDDAVQITFLLMDGTKTDMTFCGSCAEGLSPDLYAEIWRKVLRSWIRSMDGDEEKHQSWFRPQFANGLLAEIGRRQMNEVLNGSAPAVLA